MLLIIDTTNENKESELVRVNDSQDEDLAPLKRARVGSEFEVCCIFKSSDTSVNVMARTS